MVMSDVGGASEIVQHGVNGYLFRGGSTPDLVDCMSKVANAPVRARLSAEARRSAERHDINAMVAHYAGFIADLARPGGDPNAALHRDPARIGAAVPAPRLTPRR